MTNLKTLLPELNEPQLKLLVRWIEQQLGLTPAQQERLNKEIAQ